eukprot:4026104-Alexandrium_andersonii.AAC.1
MVQCPAVSCAGGAAAPPREQGVLGGAAAPRAQETAENCTMQNSAEECRIVQCGAIVRCWWFVVGGRCSAE